MCVCVCVLCLSVSVCVCVFPGYCENVVNVDSGLFFYMSFNAVFTTVLKKKKKLLERATCATENIPLLMLPLKQTTKFLS